MFILTLRNESGFHQLLSWSKHKLSKKRARKLTQGKDKNLETCVMDYSRFYRTKLACMQELPEYS
jgi:hypothetical protein